MRFEKSSHCFGFTVRFRHRIFLFPLDYNAVFCAPPSKQTLPSSYGHTVIIQNRCRRSLCIWVYFSIVWSCDPIYRLYICTRKKPQDHGESRESTREIIVSSIQKYLTAKFATIITDGKGCRQDFCWTRFLEIVKTINYFLTPIPNLVSSNFWTT